MRTEKEINAELKRIAALPYDEDKVFEDGRIQGLVNALEWVLEISQSTEL